MPQRTGEPECVRQIAPANQRVRRISSLPPSGRILSPGHRGGQQHGVATELDGAGRFGSRANARIEYDRDSGVLGNMLGTAACSAICSTHLPVHGDRDAAPRGGTLWQIEYSLSLACGAISRAWPLT